MRSHLCLPVLLLVIVLFSCSEKNGRYKKFDLKSVPEVAIEVHRYEQALFSIDPLYFEQGLDDISGEFRVFLGDHYKTPQAIFQLSDFIHSPIHQEAWAACQEKYISVAWLVDALEAGFHRYRYFYPETNDITLFTYISGYNWEHPIHILEDSIIVGIDNYLGSDFEVYKKLQIPQYISNRMDSAYLIADIFKRYIESYTQHDQKMVLIDHMIAAGKTLYFLDILLPDIPKENKIGYTKEQLKFCRDNEDMIWQFFIEHNLLFSSDYKHIRSFILDAPYTNGFPLESPGRIGEWIGWRIVDSYMNKNQQVPLQELMSELDYSKILQNSGYKPKR